MALVRQVSVAGGAVTATLLPSVTVFYGLAATNSQGTPAIYYVKLFWAGTGVVTNAAGVPTNTLPVAGTSLPQLTIAVPVGGLFNLSFAPVINGGPVYYWVSLNPSPTDTTAIATGGDVISFIYA